jgi:hypothetical protein
MESHSGEKQVCRWNNQAKYRLVCQARARTRQGSSLGEAEHQAHRLVTHVEAHDPVKDGDNIRHRHVLA